ncbi:alpha/beta fold hydrolase [Cryptosporangium sp. NPDC048952]|uniref:alpha/beta fold hydrolase n=1 Tax=Cryptosporangium sp. NPDC048952 TaxID=3363961 RepID=UPI00371A3D47
MTAVAHQRIGFRAVPGGRVAYAEVGEGPPLVLPTPWVSHLELDWEVAEYRDFVAALARTHRVIRYDRLGCGLSDRPPRPGTGVEHDTAVLTALIDGLELDVVALFGFSIGACAAICYAAARPERVTRLAIFGGYAEGARTAPDTLRTAILDTIRAHWGAGSRLLADVWMPTVDARVREAFARLQREATGAETAATVLASVYDADIRDELAAVRAPTLVLHRRNDRAIPFTLGREVAAAVPGAHFVPLDGDNHPPWLGDSGAVLASLLPFFAADTPLPTADPPGGMGGPGGVGGVGSPVAASPAGASRVVGGAEPGGGDGGGVLTEREREVLRLVAAGRSDAEIAAALVLSGHTVHRHVANIRRKLDQPSRAAAAATAIRLGLI